MDKLGNDREISIIIENKGLRPPPPKTIAGWRQRNSIPSPWVMLLLDVALKRGLVKDIPSLRQKIERRKPTLEELRALL